MNNKPLIKIFKTRGKYYLFDTNKNTILNLSKNQYIDIDAYLSNNDSTIAEPRIVTNLRNDGFLSLNKVQNIESSISELLPYYLENNVEQLILQVTQQCNFRCEYCVYSGSYYNRVHSSKRMSKETALEAIDFAISHSKNNYQLAISFYGGEPLLEFDLIKTCIEYAEERSEGKRIVFNLTSNSFLLNDEIVDFFYKHKVRLIISLDGPKEIQDDHRKFALNNGETFETVFKNIKNIQENHKEYMNFISINAVVDYKNDFNTIDNFFKNNDVVKNIEVGTSPILESSKKSGITNKNEKFYSDREYALFRNMYYLTRNKNNKNKSRITSGAYYNMINFPKRLNAQNKLSENSHPGGPCIPGSRKLFVNVNGDFYPCEKCNESSDLFKIGNLKYGFDVEKANNLLNIGKITEEQCKECWAFTNCSICAAHINESNGKFDSKDKLKLCSRVRLDFEEHLKDYCVLKEFGYDFSDLDDQMKDEDEYLFNNYNGGLEFDE